MRHGTGFFERRVAVRCALRCSRVNHEPGQPCGLVSIRSALAYEPIVESSYVDRSRRIMSAQTVSMDKA